MYRNSCFFTTRGTVFLASLLFLLIPFIAHAQDAESERSTSDTDKLDREQAAIVAMSLDDYPVTPGDVYVLTYRVVTEAVSLEIVVEQDYSINVGPFGAFDVADTTFVALRQRLQSRVIESYPRSIPRVLIRSLGRFQITFVGEVVKSGLGQATGLTRLADVAAGRATEYASMRAVTVRSRDGSRRTYDLFRFQRDGLLSQNPYLRPGDRIELRKADRIVTVEGEVRRPGRYQLQPGEHLKELIERYADGATAQADLGMTRIVRITEEADTSRTIDVSFSGHERIELKDRDTVTVRTKDEFLPVVFFEGALLPRPPSEEDGEEIYDRIEYARFPRRYRPGQALSDVVKEISDRLLPSAALDEAFVRRADDEEGRRIPVNMEDLLYQRAPANDVPLRPGDRVVIPFQQQFVVVEGEVTRAGIAEVDGLTRLSEVVEERATEYADTRNVIVNRRDGTTERYDLFGYERNGDLTENPYLRPYDTVRLMRAERIVTIDGEVRRPGTYQLRPGEQLGELIERYSDGATAEADLDGIRIVRITETDATSQTIEVSFTGNERIDLKDRDMVTVRTKDEFLPVAFFEGAIFTGEDLSTEVREGVETPSSGFARYTYRFLPGERLSHAVRQLSDRFLPSADLENAYMMRPLHEGGATIAIDLERLTYERNPEVDPKLRPGDRIMIPFYQQFVTITGGVRAPGRIGYVPDRTYEYYLAQAGGIDPNRHMGEWPKITTIDGERRDRDEVIRPEDRIHFATNSPIFYLGPITTVLSLITSTVSMYLLLSQ